MIRDTYSKAVLSTDKEQLEAYRKNKRTIQQIEELRVSVSRAHSRIDNILDAIARINKRELEE